MNEQQAAKTGSGTERPGVVFLPVKEQAQMQKLYKSVRAYLEEMAQITARALNNSKLSAQNLQKVTIIADRDGSATAAEPAARESIKIIFRNGDCVVWEDPPGICRPCVRGE